MDTKMVLKKKIFLCFLQLVFGQDREPRIINGVDASHGEFPFAVSLQIQYDNDPPGHECGGTIVNSNYVVTAAHCLMYHPETAIRVHVGVNQQNPDVTHNVESMYRHEKYTPSDNYKNDIAVLKVTPAFVFNEKVSAVTLPQKDSEVPPDTQVIVSGWGNIEDNGWRSVPLILQKLTLTVSSNVECEKFMPTGKRMYPEMMCTRETSGKPRGTCNFDSGSPLTLNKKILVGITSRLFGECGEIGKVNGFTRVSKYIDWINQHTK